MKLRIATTTAFGSEERNVTRKKNVQGYIFFAWVRLSFGIQLQAFTSIKSFAQKSMRLINHFFPFRIYSVYPSIQCRNMLAFFPLSFFSLFKCITVSRLQISYTRKTRALLSSNFMADSKIRSHKNLSTRSRWNNVLSMYLSRCSAW